MTTMTSQITSLTVVYSTFYPDTDQTKHQSSASLAFVWGIHRDRWIPRTKGQLRGKWFHLMTSSWDDLAPVTKIPLWWYGGCKIVVSSLHNGIPYTGKVAYLLKNLAIHYSLSHKMSDSKIARSIRVTRLDVEMIVSLWKPTGISAVMLPRCLLIFGAIIGPIVYGFENSR